MTIFAAFSATPVFDQRTDPTLVEIMTSTLAKAATNNSLASLPAHLALSDWIPDVVYIGSGVWTQWPVPNQPMGSWSTYALWKYFEVNLLNTLSRITAHKVIVSTVQSVCEEHLNGNEAGRRTHSPLDQCMTFLRETYGVSDEDANADCRDGQHRRHGSQKLARRVRRALIYRETHFTAGSRFQFSGNKGHNRASVKGENREQRRDFLLNYKIPFWERFKALHPTESRSKVTLIEAFNLTDGRCDMDSPDQGGSHFIGLVYKKLGLFMKAVTPTDAEIQWSARHVHHTVGSTSRAAKHASHASN